jgi:hypothetical protein
MEAHIKGVPMLAVTVDAVLITRINVKNAGNIFFIVIPTTVPLLLVDVSLRSFG